MGESAIVYTQRPGMARETEIGALANVYKFVLECRAKKEAAPESRPDDAKGSKHDSRHHHRST